MIAAYANEHLYLCHSNRKAVAKMSAERKLGIGLPWMIRTYPPYLEAVSFPVDASLKPSQRSRKPGRDPTGEPRVGKDVV